MLTTLQKQRFKLILLERGRGAVTYQHAPGCSLADKCDCRLGNTGRHAAECRSLSRCKCDGTVFKAYRLTQKTYLNWLTEGFLLSDRLKVHHIRKGVARMVRRSKASLPELKRSDVPRPRGRAQEKG